MSRSKQGCKCLVPCMVGYGGWSLQTWTKHREDSPVRLFPSTRLFVLEVGEDWK